MSKRKKKILKWIVGVIFVFLVFAFLLYLKNKPKSVEVKKVKIESLSVRKTVSASGVVVSENEVDLAFPTAGKIEKIYVKEGDVVEPGLIIAQISNIDTMEAVNAARQTKDAAIEDLNIYIENYSTNLDAVGGEDEYYLNVEKLEKLVEKAKANYQASIATHSKSFIYAPFAGTVVDVYKDNFEIASIGEKVVKVADLKNLKFEISVDQEDFGLIKMGQEVEIKLDAYEDTVFKGKVVGFTRYANEDSGDFDIDLSIEGVSKNEGSEDTVNMNLHKNILLGMRGDADIIVEKTDSSAFALPFDAIYNTNGENYVWVSENNKLKKESVEVGLEGDVYTQIKTDLSGKDVVIPIDNPDLKEGLKIKK